MNSAELFDRIEEIAGNASRTVKEELVLKLLEESELARQVIKLTYDPFITFGITPKKAKKNGDGVFDTETPQPWIMLHQLRNRELTGNAATDAVSIMLQALEPKSSQLLWRILSKDMRAGFTQNTVNRAMPGTIPVFEVMLSKEFEEKRVKQWPVAVEPKLDGFRGLWLVKPDKAQAFSRVGNHFPALDHLGDHLTNMVTMALVVAKREAANGSEIHKVYEKLLGTDKPYLAVDSEVTTGSFNKTSGDVRRQSADAEDAVINVFDAIPYKLMVGDGKEIAIPFKLRRQFVEFLVSCKVGDAPIVATPLVLANSVEEIYAVYNANRAAGLEGAMVKPLDAPYAKKKSHLWMKMKACETEDLRVTGWFEGKEGTKLEGKFGGFIVDREGVEVRIGGGFSDAEREEFLEAVIADAPINPDIHSVPRKCIGRLIEVEFHEVTPDGSLRHPRFVRFRDDKDEMLRAA
jgi:ATP-dependent DNA ligase